ncbi:hypothetical protein [Pullulanibacillus camelliae]|uniref:hypothetical protein n=1 Tax=Pullulanibacillus camelliae TaxID=1707096 RepID=UPI00166D957C|nr:hypothetical protein [Pullulanibacillus camelliae]
MKANTINDLEAMVTLETKGRLIIPVKGALIIKNELTKIKRVRQNKKKSPSYRTIRSQGNGKRSRNMETPTGTEPALLHDKPRVVPRKRTTKRYK